MGARSQVYAVIDMMKHLYRNPLPEGYTIKWDGEMKLTLDVFRDLGAAMGVALIAIYLLLVGRFRSFTIPVVIMAAIPLSMIGIMPGFAMTGVYFSATSMIGVIALAGIVVRNSIVLLEFILDKKNEGLPLVAGADRGGGHPYPADRAHGRGSDPRLGRDRDRPGLVRPGPGAHLRDAGVHGTHPGGDPGVLLYG